MRALILPAAALALAGAVVLVGGRMVDGPMELGPAVVARSDLDDVEVTEAAAPPAAVLPVAPAAAPDATSSASARSRLVAPALVAPPEIVEQQLEREAPREPLSSLSLALPPPPPPEHRNPWAGKPLFRPVAVESAVFESGGYTVAIDGVKSIAAEETCDFEGNSWACGARARGAFRLWLRGRALVCQIPEDERDEGVMRARCRLAKQDVGAWLVSNGWALAAPDGPYTQAEEKARAAKVGIFGAPPDTSSVPEVPDAPSASAEIQPRITDDEAEPQPSDPRMAFPPPPQ